MGAFPVAPSPPQCPQRCWHPPHHAVMVSRGCGDRKALFLCLRGTWACPVWCPRGGTGRPGTASDHGTQSRARTVTGMDEAETSTPWRLMKAPVLTGMNGAIPGAGFCPGPCGVLGLGPSAQLRDGPQTGVGAAGL